MSVLVVVPVLGRPERAAPLADSLYASVDVVPLRLVFVCSLGDDEQAAACTETGATVFQTDFPAGPADWAKKVNLAYDMTREPWLFTGADDLCFCPGWADRALECAEEAGAGVVGTNDLGNPRVKNGSTATHNLVARWYADKRGTIDGPGRVVSEVYDHNFVDDELVTTAKARRLWTFCADSEVPHLHPHWGDTPWDETYEKGQRHFGLDRQRFLRRRSAMNRAR